MLQVKEPTLLEKIQARQAVVGICGLGYVGLPLALTFGEKGFPVIGCACPACGRLVCQGTADAFERTTRPG